MEKNYKDLCETPSDINEHLPALKALGDVCNHVTEFGVRDVVSTYAFLESKAKIIRAYDINYSHNMTDAIRVADRTGKDLKFIIGSTLEVQIEETDLLFIDTLHTCEQLKAELVRHAHKVKKFIAFHDVVTFGYRDENNNTVPPTGLLPAIFGFLSVSPMWRIFHFNHNNNGLLILEKR